MAKLAESALFYIKCADSILSFALDYARHRCTIDLLLKYLSRVGVLIGVLTYFSCRIIAASLGHYTDGLLWSLFSSTGRDKPEYYVFVSGLSVLCVIVLVLLTFLMKRIRNWRNEDLKMNQKSSNRTAFRVCMIGIAFAMIAQPFLIVLSVLDIGNYHSIHLDAAGIYFTFTAIFYALYTGFLIKMCTVFPSNLLLRKNTAIKTALTIAYFLGYIILVPVDNAMNCNSDQLTMSECLEILDADYCLDEIDKSDPTLTILFIYRDCLLIANCMSFSQCICIFSSIFFNGSLCIDLSPSFPSLGIDDTRMLPLMA